MIFFKLIITNILNLIVKTILILLQKTAKMLANINSIT